MLQADFGDWGFLCISSLSRHIFRPTSASLYERSRGSALGSRVWRSAIGGLDGELKSWLFGYEQVRSVALEEDMLNAVRRIQKRGPWVHRLEATIESHMNWPHAFESKPGFLV